MLQMFSDRLPIMKTHCLMCLLITLCLTGCDGKESASTKPAAGDTKRDKPSQDAPNCGTPTQAATSPASSVASEQKPLSNIPTKDQVRKVASDISNLSTGIAVYQADTDGWPETLDALVSRPGNFAKWNGPYVRRGLPVDPWGHPYRYRVPSTHDANGFDLWSDCDATESWMG